MAVRDPEFASGLIGSLSSGVVAIDARGRVAALNAAAQRILGLCDEDPAARLGRDFREALRGRPQLVALLADALDGRERPSRAELVLEPRSGQPERTIGFTLVPVRGDDGAVLGAAIQFRDLTPYERLDEQARLRDRLLALGEMAAGLAHELRNPLAGLEVLAGLLKRRVADRPEERALVAELLDGLRAMARTLSDALAFVRPVIPATVPTDVTALLEDCLECALARVPFKGRVHRAYADALPRLEADPEALRTVLTDVIVNALEAMAGDASGREPELELAVRAEVRSAPDGPVRVRRSLPAQERAEGHCELVVTVGDNGPGVPPDLREKIFYPFFTTKERGSGIGLANAQKAVAGHGGSIELEARAGEGSVLQLRFPLTEGDP